MALFDENKPKNTDTQITDQHYPDAGILPVFVASLQKIPFTIVIFDDVTHVSKAISMRRCIKC